MIPFPTRKFNPTGRRLPKHAVSRHLINGGFETESFSPLGWSRNDLTEESLPPGVRANMAFDTNVAHGGYTSARITWNRKSGHAPLFWGQVIRVRQYRKVTISGWILTKDVRECGGCDFGLGTDRGNSAYLAVSFGYPSPWANPKLPSFPKIRGTSTAWRHVSQTYFVPHNAQFLSIQCVLAGKGTAWFDDVQVHTTPYRSPPGGGPLG